MIVYLDRVMAHDILDVLEKKRSFGSDLCDAYEIAKSEPKSKRKFNSEVRKAEATYMKRARMKLSTDNDDGPSEAERRLRTLRPRTVKE
jgi:hypothetical protein